VISGDGALSKGVQGMSGVSEIDEVIAKLVVNRGDEPLPPGERLALRSPGTPSPELEQSNHVDSGDSFKFGSFHIQL
jgi:hypothetical protein